MGLSTGLSLSAGCFDLQRLRVLRLMRMIRADVSLKLAQHHVPQFVFGQHSSNGFPQDLFWLPLKPADGCFASQSGITGVPGVILFLPFFAGEPNLFDINHDNEIARVNVRRVGRSMLAHEDDGNLTGQSTDDLVRTVNQMP